MSDLEFKKTGAKDRLLNNYILIYIKIEIFIFSILKFFSIPILK
jgi:hypothetical protein